MPTAKLRGRLAATVPGEATSDKRIEVVGRPADRESRPLAGVGMAATGCEGRLDPRRRQGNHHRGARPGTAPAGWAAPRSLATVGPDRVSHLGIQPERCMGGKTQIC